MNSLLFRFHSSPIQRCSILNSDCCTFATNLFGGKAIFPPRFYFSSVVVDLIRSDASYLHKSQSSETECRHCKNGGIGIVTRLDETERKSCVLQEMQQAIKVASATWRYWLGKSAWAHMGGSQWKCLHARLQGWTGINLYYCICLWLSGWLLPFLNRIASSALNLICPYFCTASQNFWTPQNLWICSHTKNVPPILPKN